LRCAGLAPHASKGKLAAPFDERHDPDAEEHGQCDE
jgi:hypothetical protein